MADFDGSGFDAVDAFFGVSNSSSSSNITSRDADNHPPSSIPEAPQNALSRPFQSANRDATDHHHRKQRGGVGATAAAATTAWEQTMRSATTNVGLSSKRILQVGSAKKRRRKQGFGEDDDDEEEEGAPPHSDNEEEESGRTAVDNKGTTSKSSAAKVVSASVAALEKLNKKKMGKKERRLQQQQQQPQFDENDEQRDREESTTNNAPDGAETKVNKSSEGDESAQRSKRKRRKVRSRQKNIRKDHRDVKPAHLVPGQRHYQGRPLTEETRARLNLPTIVKSPFDASTEWTGGNGPDNHYDDDDKVCHSLERSNHLDAMPLAVDNNDHLHQQADVTSSRSAKDTHDATNKAPVLKGDQTNTKDGKSSRETRIQKKYKNL